MVILAQMVSDEKRDMHRQPSTEKVIGQTLKQITLHKQEEL